MIAELVRALIAALCVGVLPGWFWARALHPGGDGAARLCLSIGLSFALVPAVALVPARFLGLGVTLPVAALSVLGVFAAGLAVCLISGAASYTGKSDAPLAPVHEIVPANETLIAIMAASGTMLAVYFGAPLVWALPPLGLLLAVAVFLHRRDARVTVHPEARAVEAGEPAWTVPARRGIFAAVVGLVLFRGYSGVVIHDWPFIRGVDQYNHGVMANRMMSVGEIEPYLIYPPGFHTMTAAISRLSGLRPLEIFPVLAPALLLLPMLALYALARRLWGPWCGLAAAAFGGLVFSGSYQYFSDAMYPNMTAAQFLMVLAVLALCELYARPSLRSAALFVLIGASVVLFHPVASLYLALLLALVGLFVLPPLFLRDRLRGLALFASLAGVGVLSLAYAWDTYGIGEAIRGLTEQPETGGTREAVRMAIGTQMPFLPQDLVGIVLTEPVAWFGLFGASLLAFSGAPDRRGEADTTNRLVRVTLLLWLAVMAAGSATPLSGFPQRFSRDLGVPLSLLAALALVALVASLVRRGSAAPLALSLAVPLVATVIGMQAWLNLEGSTGESTPLTFTLGLTVTPEIAAAGDWLREHNEGGKIMISPQANQVPSRMMLAMGEYGGMQSYTEFNIEYGRDLPPAGAGAMRDVLWVMNHPEGQLTERYLREYDVRYLVLFKDLPDREVYPYWTLFDDPGLPYGTVFENEDVLIVEPREPATS